MAYRWITGGGNVCNTCRSRNGKVRANWGADFPAHPNCNCQIVRVDEDDEDGDGGGLSSALRRAAQRFRR